MENYFNIKHVWKNLPVNIAHFLHDVLFHGIVKYIDNNSIKWILDNDLSDWEYNITICIIEHLHINFEINNTGIDTKFIKTNRNIKNHKYYIQVMEIIRTSVFNKYNIIEKSNKISYKVLYFRDDTTRRKMLNYNNDLNHMFDEVITNMGSKSFEDQVKLFNKTTHFVTIEGAHLTNIIFMNSNTNILVFSPIFNSWQVMFGTSKLVNNFEIKTTGGDFNSDIYYNDNIKNNIIKLIATKD
tara:strand:+ start:778 stop:1500 length:723 start_codon:yes stop_codon:yes gene_type:complete